MGILHTIAASYSLVALLLVVSQWDTGAGDTYKDARCGHGRPKLTKEEIEGEVSFRFFNHNKSCVHVMATASETKGFKRLHDCVTNCETGQGAEPRCAGPRVEHCNSHEECLDEVYYFDAHMQKCVQFNAPFEVDIRTNNIFMFIDTCEDYCMGFTEDDLKKARQKKAEA
uniref:Putative kunitz-type peptidase inhibitor n=1 Tax=Amblyomma americanum TaxID=6943 RepID=Q868G5_AMBAM|nr:putative kunitz-type peptidase inhibitor [Amblyomma americanum]